MNAPRMSVTRPDGLCIDLGAIGKGYTVDAAARMLAPVQGFVINACGDIFASGSGPDGDGWLISIACPRSPGEGLCTVRLYDQAVATSAISGGAQHRLIDPSSGRPPACGVLSATVIAGAATEADAFATAALLLGPEKSREFLDLMQAQALFAMEDGRLVATDGWPGISRA